MEVRRRYTMLDAVRGACLVSMILYHGAYDLAYIYGIHIPGYKETAGYLWQQSICWTFILLSGMCWSLGRHPLKRGLAVSIGGAVISLVTAAVMPEQIVRFGILTFLGAAMLLMIPVEKAARHITPVAGLAVSIPAFVLCRNVNAGELGFEGFVLCRLPQVFQDCALLEFMGFPSPGFYSSDYFSLLPWFFLYLTGYFVWRLLKGRQSLQKLLLIRIPVLERLGKNTLPVYMLHQPALMLLLEALYRTGLLG